MNEVGIQRFGIYLPTVVHERLRTIAFEERTSINRLVLDAVEQMLAKRARRKTKTGKRGR